MRFLLTILFLMVIFGGCAQQNAFERFHITKLQELAEDNIQSSKIIDKKAEVVGVVTAIHLNKIEPKIYTDYEYFYVYMYAKNKNNTINFFLNNKPALLVEELPAQNEFTKLTSFHSKWNKYYLIGFAKQQGTLNLTVAIGQSSTTLIFKQDQ
ncbi:hypothetical protein [Sulfurimonas sp.]